MKFPSAVTAAGNAIRKLHRQSDQAEIIVCGEFIIHVKHDYALRRVPRHSSRISDWNGSWRKVCHKVR